MGNETGFIPWFASGAPAIWGGFFALAIWWIRGIPARKEQHTAAKRSAAEISDGLLERSDARNLTLEDRMRHLEEREEECQHKLTDALGRIAELEGYNLGRGRADQDAQRIVSEEREANKQERRGEQ